MDKGPGLNTSGERKISHDTSVIEEGPEDSMKYTGPDIAMPGLKLKSQKKIDYTPEKVKRIGIAVVQEPETFIPVSQGTSVHASGSRTVPGNVPCGKSWSARANGRVSVFKEARGPRNSRNHLWQPGRKWGMTCSNSGNWPLPGTTRPVIWRGR